MGVLGLMIMNWKIIRTEEGNSFTGVLDSVFPSVLKNSASICLLPITLGRLFTLAKN